MTFNDALCYIKNGDTVTRTGWNGKDMYLYLVKGSGHPVSTKEYLPYISMRTADNKHVPWLASQTDLLQDDWEIFVTEE